MKKVIVFTTIVILGSFLTGCSGQNNGVLQNVRKGIIGGGCDGCELMYIGMPENIPSVDTSPGWYERGQKLIITGKVFQIDGETPAPNIIIYYWHTDNNGYYSPKPGMDEQAKSHGHLRGWVKTDPVGGYTIRTLRPAPYPRETGPAHIHLSIKEPRLPNEYYTDEINFKDDKLLAPHLRKYPQDNRGGSGVVSVSVKDSTQIAKHDIILGLNIPNYPKQRP